MTEMAPETHVPDQITKTARCLINGNHPTEPPAQLCRRCEDTLRGWLRDIPNRYALLPAFIGHGTTDRNPDSKATKRAEAAAPMRLEIIDLLDTRLGRKWQGTDVTNERRGALGTLDAIARDIHDGRQLTGPIPNHVAGLTDYIARHILWLVEQDWIDDAFNEIKALHRAISDAVGIYRPKPVGRCHVIPDGADAACDGPLLANAVGGVRCPRCESTWDADNLRILGAALGSQEGA